MKFDAKRILLALASGGITAGALVWWRGAGSAASAEPMGTVLIVKQRISASEVIAAEDLKVEPRPARFIPANAVTSVGMAVNRRPRWDLVPGDIVLQDKLYGTGEFGPLRIPAGKRAVALAVDEVVGVAGFVQPGSLVDVIAVLQVNDEPVSKLVLQGVPVLAVAQDDATPDDKDPGARISSSVTLAVTPAEAEKLVLATERGKIRLAMRSPDERGVVQTSGSNPESLQGIARKAPPRQPTSRPPAPQRVAKPPRRMLPAGAPAAAPVAAPAIQREQVEVIRGNRTERQDFPIYQD